MDQHVEEQFLDVLQNIEAAIQMIDRDQDDLTDMEVADAINTLIQTYSAEASGRTPSALRLSPMKRTIYDKVRWMCELRMGRDNLLETKDGEEKPFPVTMDGETVTAAEIVLCLKRIQKSIKFWNQSNGRRGYLEYVGKFVL